MTEKKEHKDKVEHKDHKAHHPRHKSPKKNGSYENAVIGLIVVLAFVFIFGLFIVGYDQGHIFSVVQGEQAFLDQFLHEFSHDLRHAAGFPCH